MTLMMTLSGVEQALGAVVLVAGAFVVVAYGGGYVWYRSISYPLARRAVRRVGIVVVGSTILGDSVFVTFTERDWRPATFKEWRSVKVGEDETPPTLWPTRTFAEDELLS